MSGTFPPKGLNETQRGIIWIVSGIVVLLYAFNLFAQSLNFLVILGGVTMVGYGFIKMGGIERFQKMINRS